jgi:hypothetical protein
MQREKELKEQMKLMNSENNIDDTASESNWRLLLGYYSNDNNRLNSHD